MTWVNANTKTKSKNNSRDGRAALFVGQFDPADASRLSSGGVPRREGDIELQRLGVADRQ